MNLDRFKKPYSLDSRTVDKFKFDLSMLDKIFEYAFETEKSIKTDPEKALVNCRKAVEQTAIASTALLPRNVMIGYINEKFRDRYNNSTYTPSFSGELMKAAKNERVLKDRDVTDKMYQIYKTCSKYANHTSSSQTSPVPAFSEVVDCFSGLYFILSKLTGQQVPPVNTDDMPINGYYIIKKYSPSAYGDETKVYLARNKQNATAVIYEYSKEAEKTNKAQKVEEGSALSNNMRSAEVRSLLNTVSVNHNTGYGDSYYMIYNTSSVDERLDKAIARWRKNGDENLENALKIGSYLLDSLYALKMSKIHHRNICPENIFVSYKDMFAQLTNIGMVKFDKNVSKNLSKISQETEKTLGINDYGIDYFTKNRYTPKGMRDIYYNGISLQSINWEIVDVYSVIKVISTCFSEDSLKDQIEYAANEAASEIFRIALEIDKLTGEQLQNGQVSNYSVQQLQELVNDALDKQ